MSQGTVANYTKMMIKFEVKLQLAIGCLTEQERHEDQEDFLAPVFFDTFIFFFMCKFPSSKGIENLAKKLVKI